MKEEGIEATRGILRGFYKYDEEEYEIDDFRTTIQLCGGVMVCVCVHISENFLRK